MPVIGGAGMVWRAGLYRQLVDLQQKLIICSCARSFLFSFSYLVFCVNHHKLLKATRLICFLQIYEKAVIQILPEQRFLNVVAWFLTPRATSVESSLTM